MGGIRGSLQGKQAWKAPQTYPHFSPRCPPGRHFHPHPESPLSDQTRAVGKPPRNPQAGGKSPGRPPAPRAGRAGRPAAPSRRLLALLREDKGRSPGREDAGCAGSQNQVAATGGQTQPPPDGKLPEEPSNDPASFPSGNKGRGDRIAHHE